jgi:TonB-dependent SusC/RagA subfamily outer membrane receptor
MHKNPLTGELAMNRRPPGRALALPFFLTLLLAPSLAAQQRYTLVGRVVAANTLAPLAGAQVAVRGTTAGTLTDATGTYRLQALFRPGQYVVEATYLGREGEARNVTLAGAAEVQVPDIVMREVAVQLGEIVVTGAAVSTARRAIGNAVSTVAGQRLAEVPAVTIDQALQGKVPGAVITSNTGTPGGGVSVRLRGTSSIVGGAEPLYIVDGVIIDNNADQQLNLGYRSNATNRLADLDPDDIERIEILKGASAAALYGSRANNGVVQIFTKRGRRGAPQITVGTTATFSQLAKRIPFALTPVDPNGVAVTRYDHQDLIFRDTWSGDSYASLSGGSEDTRFYLSGNWVDQNGIMLGSDHQKLNFRANVDQRVGEWFDLGVGANYIRTWNDLVINGENGTGGLLTSIVFTPTTTNLAERDPVTGQLRFPTGTFPNPLEVLQNWQNGQQVSRFVGSLQARANPVRALNLEYRLGYDRYEMETEQSIPRGSPNAANGSATSLNRRSTLLNNDVVGALDLGDAETFRFTTSLGLNHTYQRLEQLNLSATDLVPGTRLVRGAVPGASEALIELVTLGVFAQEQIGWKDRRFLTAAVRWDASSTFGVDERWQLYPKVSGSWVLSQEPFWEPVGDWFSQFRLRGALGYAGNQPPLSEAYARLPRYTQVTNVDRLGLIPLATPANPDLKPERQREWELGFDASFLEQRYGIGFTYYDQRTEDLLLPRPFTPSAGYASILDNVGVLSNKGIELELTALPIDRESFGWTTKLIWSRNRNKVEKLNIAPYFVGYTNRIEEGKPLGVHFMIGYQRDADGKILSDTIGPLGTAPSRVVLGSPWPDYTASLANDFRIGRNWTASFLLDGSFGHQLWNQTRRIMDIFAAGPLYDRLLKKEITPAHRTRIQGIWEAYLEDATYVKLRDLSLRYSTEADWIRWIGASRAQFEIVGRNLITWTDYSGYDPEINMFGLSTVERGTDFAVYPNPRTVGFGVRLTY